MFKVFLCIVASLVIWITKWLYKWRNPSCKGRLPPGSMGFPLLGETIQFLRPHSSLDIHPFVKNRMRRYGSLFKTNLFGRPVIVSTDPDFSHFIFQQKGNSVEFWYLDSFMKLVGQQTLAKGIVSIHKYIKNMIMDHFGPGKQKETLPAEMEEMALDFLDIWSKKESVEAREEMSTLAIQLGSMKLLSYDPSKYPKNLKDTFTSLLQGIISFPLYIPGTLFYKCINDQKVGIAILKDLIEKRLNSAKCHRDLLDVVIKEIKKDDALFTIEKYPSVLKALTDEHEAIIKKRERVDSLLTWREYRSMTFTSHVIDETLRLGNIASLMLRRATRDIQINGYTVPSGWTIMIYPPALHLNPDKYEDPFTFNPWRWKGQGSNTASKTFLAFGGGMRSCAGAEFAKVQMSVVLHLLVTKYRWTKIKGGEVARTPILVFPNGLHIKVTKNTTDDQSP